MTWNVYKGYTIKKDEIIPIFISKPPTFFTLKVYILDKNTLTFFYKNIFFLNTCK